MNSPAHEDLVPDRDWGKELPVAELPGAQDIEAVATLAAAHAQPHERAAEAQRRGLLKDLACFFAHDAGKPAALRQRRVADLGDMLEAFEATAEALGFVPQYCSGDNSLPAESAAAEHVELRLRECRIENCASSTEVHWPVRLEHCTWPGPATFMGVHFHGNVTFVGARFCSTANFFAVTFDGDAFFGGASFAGEVDFRGAAFRGEVNFMRADFSRSLELKYADFAPTATLNVHELRFAGTTAMGGALNVRCAQIRCGSWPRYRGRIDGEHSGNVRELAQACEQYGELEANFAAQGSPDSSAARDWCHYRYMDLRRVARFGRWSPKGLLDWLFLKWCFGYGLHTKRILLTGVLVILAFAMLYFTNGAGLGAHAWAVEDAAGGSIAHQGPWYIRFGNCLYFSAVTFTTVGYGDLHPVHWAKLAGALEGILGVFIMAVFTVSFARKIIR